MTYERTETGQNRANIYFRQMKNAHLDKVTAFHQAFDIPVHGQPQLPDNSRLQLRATLVMEEAKEVAEALTKQGLPEIAKELCDLYIVLQGTILELGLQDVMDEAVQRVHKSNMSKLGRDGKPVHRADGKVIKGPDYQEARLEDLFG